MKNIKYPVLLLGSLSVASFASAQIVDSGFGTTGPGIVNPQVDDSEDAGWNWSSGRGEVPSSGGNPDSFFDLTQPNTANQTSLVQIFSSAGAGTVQGELLQFDFFLEDLGGSPVFSDNELRVEVFGTDSDLGFATRLEVGSPGQSGTNYTSLLDETLTADVQSATGWTTFTTGAVASGTDYDSYGLRITGFNFADGGGQPGQEGAGIDNLNFVDIPELSSFALLAGLFGLGWMAMSRRR